MVDAGSGERHLIAGVETAVACRGGRPVADVDDAASEPAADGSALLDDDWPEWADYVPDPIVIPEARRQELREEARRYVEELIEEFGEPTAAELARSEAWWRPIAEHLNKPLGKEQPRHEPGPSGRGYSPRGGDGRIPRGVGTRLYSRSGWTRPKPKRSLIGSKCLRLLVMIGNSCAKAVAAIHMSFSPTWSRNAFLTCP